MPDPRGLGMVQQRQYRLGACGAPQRGGACQPHTCGTLAHKSVCIPQAIENQVVMAFDLRATVCANGRGTQVCTCFLSPTILSPPLEPRPNLTETNCISNLFAITSGLFLAKTAERFGICIVASDCIDGIFFAALQDISMFPIHVFSLDCPYCFL